MKPFESGPGWRTACSPGVSGLSPVAHAVGWTLTTPGSFPNSACARSTQIRQRFFFARLAADFARYRILRRSRFTRPRSLPIRRGWFPARPPVPATATPLSCQHGDDARHEIGEHNPRREIRCDREFLDLKVGEPSSQAVFWSYCKSERVPRGPLGEKRCGLQPSPPGFRTRATSAAARVGSRRCSKTLKAKTRSKLPSRNGS